jgi:Flp pilus assembly protein TadB
MAQTKRKRRTKHRGTAAGTIQARGRTGRPLSPEEKKKQARVDARERRLNTPPTWKSSFTKAAFASVIIFAFIAATAKKNGIAAGAGFAVVAMVIYAPAGYYLELFLFRRRQRQQGMASGPKKR